MKLKHPKYATRPCLMRFFVGLAVAGSMIANAQTCTATKADLSGGKQLPIILSGGGVFVAAQVNGQPATLILDSGSQDSVMDFDAIKRLHLSVTDTHLETEPGGQAQEKTLKDVRRSIAGIPLIESSETGEDLSGLIPLFGLHYDGILGYDFFKQFTVILDYRNRCLTLIDPHKSVRFEGREIAANLASKQPYIDTSIKTKTSDVVHASLEIDTGKIDPFSLNAKFARRTGLFTDASPQLAAQGVSEGGTTEAWLTRASSLTLAGFTLQDPTMGVADETVDRDGQLGFGVLSRFTISFDYGHNRVFLQANDAIDQPFEFDHAGLILGGSAAGSTALTVFEVLAGTPAAKAGLKGGDVVLAINGRHLTLDKARDVLEQAQGPQVFQVSRSGKTFSTTVFCRRLI